MEDSVYDSDDARGRSTPPLERSQVDTRPYQSPPPPFLPSDKSESPKEKEGKPGRARKGPHRHRREHRNSLATESILKILAPDRPDIYAASNQVPSSSDSPSEAPSEASDGPGETAPEREPDVLVQNNVVVTISRSQDAPVNYGKPPSFQKDKTPGPLDVMNLCDPWIPPTETSSPNKDHASANPVRVPVRNHHSTQPPKPQYTLPMLGSHPEDRDVAGGLLRLKEDPAHLDRKCPRIVRSHESTLPSLHSPPQSIGSPDSSRNLPSIKSLVEGPLNDSPRLGGSTQSPFPMIKPLDRHHIPPSFSRATSFTRLTKEISSLSPTPALSTSQGSFWAPHLNAEGSQSQSPCDTSSHFTGSPATAYPTPVESRKDEVEDPLPCHKRIKTCTPQASNLFKCDYPGCTADPFQTQYLLNSHANVHSENRPYYCDVKDCPRSEGGKGFKRKNEMIRHGLVHNSPGYVCPFCADQQRRYPRPDNLQRHVRAQHADKDKDDPLLRNVLAKRSEGVARGRRRRP